MDAMAGEVEVGRTIAFRHGKRADGFAAVTDLSPVIAAVAKAVGMHQGKPRRNALGDYRIVDGGTFRTGERGVQPVVPDAKGSRHLRRIEKVSWIPIGEGRGAEHLPRGTAGEPGIAGEAIEAGEQNDASFHIARGGQ